MYSRWLPVLLASCALVACFDTRDVDLTHSVEVDDFEDGDQWADPSSGFGPWYCSAWYGDKNVNQECPAGSPGFDSEAAGFLTYRLERLEKFASTGALLGVASKPAQNLKPFRSLHFSAKLREPEPRPPDVTRLDVELTCPGALADLPATQLPVITYYNRENDKFGLELTGDWNTYTLPLAHFEEPWWQGSALDPKKCIEQVEALQFVIAPDLSSRESAAGTLWIDDVSLE